MARPPQHHPLNGDELRTIIENRVKQGILQSMNLRVMYSYPLVKYKVTIDLIPYESQGRAEPVVDTKGIQRLIVEGQEFVEVIEEAIQLTHDSPIIGWEKDPQVERDEIGLGKMETRRVEGQFVDVNVGQKIKIEEPELPPARGRNLAQRTTTVEAAPSAKPAVPPVKKARITAEEALGADHVPVDVGAGLNRGDAAPVTQDNPGGIPQAEAEQIARVEAETWSSPSPDPALNAAIQTEQPLPGRVTVLKK